MTVSAAGVGVAAAGVAVELPQAVKSKIRLKVKDNNVAVFFMVEFLS
jgi:hypothetical protein